MSELADRGAQLMEPEEGRRPLDVPSPEENRKLNKLLEAAMRIPDDKNSRNKFYYVIIGGILLSLFGLFVAGYISSVVFDL